MALIGDREKIGSAIVNERAILEHIAADKPVNSLRPEMRRNDRDGWNEMTRIHGCAWQEN